MKKRTKENKESEKEVVWESKRKYYIDNKKVNHATWFSSILVTPRVAYKILETEKTGKNVLEEEDENKLKEIRWKAKEPFSNKEFCLTCRKEILTGEEIYLCTTCGCIYCKNCAGKELYFRTEKAKDGTYCSN